MRVQPSPSKWAIAAPGILACALVATVESTGRASASLTTGTARAEVKEIAPRHYLVSEPTSNLVLFAGAEASVVTGALRPALVKKAQEIVTQTNAGPIRYALIMEEDSSVQYMDGGLGSTGTLTLAHERSNWRLREAAAVKQHDHTGGAAHATDATPSGRPAALGIPLLTFSNVVQLWFEEEDIHFIFQRKGYTDADVIAHYEGPGILQLGSTFTMDGYPSIDLAHGGTLNGMIDAAEYFIREFAATPDRVEPIVPGRGPLATLKDLRLYSDMLIAVRHRVAEDIERKRNLEQVLSHTPTAEFDARWGSGPVSPEKFVTMVFESVTKYGLE